MTNRYPIMQKAKLRSCNISSLKEYYVEVYVDAESIEAFKSYVWSNTRDAVAISIVTSQSEPFRYISMRFEFDRAETLEAINEFISLHYSLRGLGT